ncbi:MAG: hypothetical protein WBF48_02755 [Halarcobacter sp.]
MAKYSLEKNIEKRFFDNLLNQEEGFENTAINVYQKLVLIRYIEVIKNSFPLFIDEISQNKLEKSVKAFMKNSPKTPFVWQIPNEYRKFVKKAKLFDDKKYLYELMYYDWIEIEIYMKEYKFKKQKKFSYKEKYILSKSARIKRFKFDIINKEYKTKRENFVAIYQNFKTIDVVYREINQLIFLILKKINKKQSLGDVLKEICKENELDFKEAKTLLQEPFEELFLNKVLIVS